MQRTWSMHNLLHLLIDAIHGVRDLPGQLEVVCV